MQWNRNLPIFLQNLTARRNFNLAITNPRSLSTRHPAWSLVVVLLPYDSFNNFFKS